VADFVGKDPRGVSVVLPQTTFDKSLGAHFDFLESRKGVWATLTQALQNPICILDNLPHVEATMGPPRRAGELYVSHVPEWEVYVAFPVLVIEQGSYARPGAQTIDAPVRIAWTAYDVSEIPSGNIIWKAST